MDPNANLEEQLRLAARMVEEEGFNAGEVQRLAELVLALDGWLSAGGFLPTKWERK